jgi:signal transduction histidine kinase
MGTFSSYYVYKKVGTIQKNLLLSRAETVASLISPSDIGNIDSLKTKFKGIVTSNSDIRFAYALGRDESSIYFIADSEDPSSPDYSPYGQVYTEASDILKGSFVGGISAYEIASDRWGTWFSAFAPISVNGRTLALIGLDIDARNYYWTIFLYSSIPVVITLILLIIITSGYVIYKKEKDTLKTKSDFITQASHDLRSPLSGIRWGAESLLKSAGGYSKDDHTTISMIYTSTLKIASILKDLMQIAVIDSKVKRKVVRTTCNIVEIVETSIKDLDLFAKEKNVHIQNELHEKNMITLADAQDLKQVFSNLISNAIKYSNSGSHVHISSALYGKYNVIFISDKGIGIPIEEQKKVLQGFYRSTNARKLTDDGTGLGLYSAKKVVELYGGTLTFKSEENKGSTFIVSLPKTNEK